MNYNKDMQIEGAKTLLEANRPSGLNPDGIIVGTVAAFRAKVDR